MLTPFGEGFAMIIIDESFWQDGINIDANQDESLGEELDTFPVRYRKGMKRDNDTWHLADLIGRVQLALLMPCRTVHVQRQPLLDAG